MVGDGGVGLDGGGAHIRVGVDEAIATMSKRITSVHVHDNHGTKDEHLWPGDGTIDWKATAEALNKLEKPPAIVMEISQSLGETPATIPDKVAQGFERFS